MLNLGLSAEALGQRRKRRSVLDRAMEKFEPEPNSGCWLWVGGRDRHGYGVIRLGGVDDGRTQAHRVLYQHFVGPIPKGLELDHKCRMPCCVNPDHLEAVTHYENVRRGRAREAGLVNIARWNAVRSAREFCAVGHPFDESNTLWKRAPNGARWRRCRACTQKASREATRRYRARKGGQSHV